jgi:Bacterial SH3 domain.
MGGQRNPVPGLSEKLLDLAPHNDYTIKSVVCSIEKLFHSIKGVCEMKTLFLSSICIVLLTACSIPPTGVATPTQTKLPSPAQVQLPTSTNTESPTLTPAGLKYCVVPALLNIRSGPGTQYAVLAIEAQGICGLATARNEDASWVYITTNKYTGWAFVKYLSGEGDISTLPVFTELTPTP